MAAAGKNLREAELREDLIAEWREQDFAVFTYPPVRLERGQRRRETTRLLLAFKDGDKGAIRDVISHCLPVLRRQRERLRDEFDCRYILAVPRSRAGVINIGCEQLCSALADEMSFLTHLPSALARTSAVDPSHRRGVHHSVDTHLSTITFRPPIQTSRDTPTYCAEHDRVFRTQKSKAKHMAKFAHYQSTGSHEPRGYIVVDDIITTGATSAACRRVVSRATNAAHVVGLFVARTQGR